MRCVSTKRPFDLPVKTVSCRTRARPTKWRRGSTRRAARNRSPIPVCVTRRYCYLRWGADGKVRQLDRLHPHLSAADGSRPTAITGSTIQQLDVASIVKASQALSSEIELPKLIERLMTIALENAGADRGLLILPAGEDYLIQAQGQTTGDQVEVVLRQTPITRLTCPNSLLRYVIRTRESVIIGDASRPNPFSEDDYLRSRQPRSILCLPLIKQGRLTGAALPREHIDLARVHAGSDGCPQTSGLGSRDLAGKHPPL